MNGGGWEGGACSRVGSRRGRSRVVNCVVCKHVNMADVAQYVLRVLMEEEDVNAWLVSWTDQRVVPILPQSHQHAEGSMKSTTSSASTETVSWESADNKTPARWEFPPSFILRHRFDDLSADELRCLPYLPRQADLDDALIFDVDVNQLNEKSFTVLVPMFEKSRFVFGVKYTNSSMVPLPEGVFKLPAHRFCGFRTRMKLDVFHTMRLERNATILSSMNMERAGVCMQQPLCQANRVCLCWRPRPSRLSDQDLAGAVPWSSFADHFGYFMPAVSRGESTMNSCSRLGNGHVVFKGAHRARFQSARGSEYSNIHRLRFLFFDRLSTASTIRGSLAHSIKYLGTNDLISPVDGQGWRSDFLREDISEIERGTSNGREHEYLLLSKKKSIESGCTQNSKSSSRPSSQSKGSGSTGDGILCHICSKSFVRKGDLNRHIKTIHEGRRNHTCKQCDRSFVQLDHLRTHIRVVHEKRRDFLCTWCGVTFAVESNLKKHLKTIHPDL